MELFRTIVVQKVVSAVHCSFFSWNGGAASVCGICDQAVQYIYDTDVAVWIFVFVFCFLKARQKVSAHQTKSADTIVLLYS